MNILTVDGIDVSGCDAYTHNHNELMPNGDVLVTEHYCYHVNRECNGKNCEYKQLKRLEQENERLKEELRTEKIYSSQIEELEGSLQHAKAENEELSESIKRLKNMAKAAALGREKYKQALQEIRDIAGSIIGNANATYTDFYNKLSDILDKINSVIGAE